MKFSKLFVRILIGCVLLGASGAAMARNDCGTASTGFISNQTLDEFVMDEFDICTLTNVTVTGNVRVVGADGFTMINSTVEGNVFVTAAVTALQGNNFGGRLVLNRARAAIPLTVALARVVNNVVDGGGDVRISDGANCGKVAGVYVADNHVLGGNLTVNCNKEAIVIKNTVVEGNITCRSNRDLRPSTNVSFGGTVNCSKGVSDGLVQPEAE